MDVKLSTLQRGLTGSVSSAACTGASMEDEARDEVRGKVRAYQKPHGMHGARR